MCICKVRPASVLHKENESIIAAAISGAVTLIVCMVNNHYQNTSTKNLTDYRLTKLEEKVDKHNNVVDGVVGVKTWNELNK